MTRQQDHETNFTYVPPPKTDITPALLAQSLAEQPQDTATVASVKPYFADDIIVYGVQMNGFVASSLYLNASTDIPCDSIGTVSAISELELRPKDVYNRTAAAYVPDCSIIAVNMYNPNLLNYWVQTSEGTLHSLVGSNKVIDIDQLNTTASVSLVLRAKQAGVVKRDNEQKESQNLGVTIMQRAARRAILPPDIHIASMTAEACAAIKCNNNGGKSAIFNQFTSMCGCREPSYVQLDKSS